MMSSVVIPQDIIDSIIEAVGDDTHSLKKCCLVSSNFLLPCRKRLLSRITLPYGEACQRLHKFLVENPVLQFFVKTIYVMIPDDEFEFDSHISIFRLPFCSPESLFISPWEDYLYWSDFSSELRDALSTIIHSSALKTLHLTRIIDVPIALFWGIHLTKLVLDGVRPRFDLCGKQSRLLTPPTPEEVEMTTTTVIDQIVWRFDEPAHGLPDPMFLPFMSHLRLLEIEVNPNSTVMGHFDILTFLIRSLCLCPSSPATLEHIKFSIKILVNDIMLDNDGFYEELETDEVWEYLDSIITHPAGSRLQRVDLDISFWDDDGDTAASESILEPILEQLLLLRGRGILYSWGRQC